MGKVGGISISGAPIVEVVLLSGRPCRTPSPPQVDTSAAIQVLAEHIGAQDNANVAWLKHTIKTNPKADTLLKAVIVNELLEYPRDIVAIAATPSIARAIGRAPPKVKS